MAKAKCIIKTVIVSGGSRGGARGARPPLFLDQTEARRTEKKFFEPPPPISHGLDTPPPPYLKVWIRHWLFDTFKCRLSSGRTTCTIIHPRYEEVSL